LSLAAFFSIFSLTNPLLQLSVAAAQSSILSSSKVNESFHPARLIHFRAIRNMSSFFSATHVQGIFDVCAVELDKCLGVLEKCGAPMVCRKEFPFHRSLNCQLAYPYPTLRGSIRKFNIFSSVIERSKFSANDADFTPT
jgi:hypothetical protein